MSVIESIAPDVRIASSDDLTAMRLIADDAFDREPIERAEIVDLLYHRPPEDELLRIVASIGGAVVGFAFGSVHRRCGYLDAIAVTAEMRHRGVGTALVRALEDNLLQRGATRLAVGGNSWYYPWPGVDLGYTAALCLLECEGYQRTDPIQNMDVDLRGWKTGNAEGALRPKAEGVTLRRGRRDDWRALKDFVTREFSETWRHEAELALHREVPAVFVAVRGSDVVGFACHGVYRTDWFGPIGTDPNERGSGIGEALLRLCLDDLARLGLDQAQICWIGPMHFYSRVVDARCGRQFLTFSKLPAAH